MAGEYRFLKIKPGGDTALVTISRPGDRNSINTRLMAEIAAALAELEATDARAVIFTGSGDEYFIGGADGIEMMQCTPEMARAFSRRIQAMFDRMEASPLILAAAINGLCFGGGFEFALACDLRVAKESARIGLPETKVGIIPGGGGTQRLPRLVGMGLAMEMILTGRLFKGEAAGDMGLVNRVAPDGELITEAQTLVDSVLRQPAYAVRHAKLAVRAAARMNLDAGQQVESKEFSACFSHGYFVELMREQLKKGLLVTTSELPPGFLD